MTTRIIFTTLHTAAMALCVVAAVCNLTVWLAFLLPGGDMHASLVGGALSVMPAVLGWAGFRDTMARRDSGLILLLLASFFSIGLGSLAAFSVAGVLLLLSGAALLAATVLASAHAILRAMSGETGRTGPARA